MVLIDHIDEKGEKTFLHDLQNGGKIRVLTDDGYVNCQFDIMVAHGLIIILGPDGLRVEIGVEYGSSQDRYRGSRNPRTVVRTHG